MQFSWISISRALASNIRMRALLVSLLICVALVSCGMIPQSLAATRDEIATRYGDRPNLLGLATVQMEVETAAGSGTVEMVLNGAAAPLTAGNFVQLASQGFYDGLNFHRVVKDPLPFVVQGGDPLGNGTGGFVDPETQQPRQIPLELPLEPRTDNGYTLVYNETIPPNGLVLPHLRGAVAMARSAAPNTASSQFYIALSDIPQLDGRYAVFGYVTEGMDVVDRIAIGDRIVSATVTDGLDNLNSAQVPQ
ncbi:MAG: peptidylprolyl isomerase [Cyanobacteria bacterium P01_E01_bin.34]